MTEQEPGSGFRGFLAGAREPVVDRRSDLPNFADADPGVPENDLHDISKTLFGAQASTGKAVFSASRMTVNPNSQQHALHDQLKRKEEREARELANLARWNTEMTTVGGVQMTNAQAQTARQNVIDNADAYADWAVRKGLIREDEKDEFKASVRRKKELEDKRGRGTLTPEETEEEHKLDRSRVGKAIDAATAQNHLDKGNTPSASADQARAAVSAASALDEDRKSPFQSAKDLGTAFAAVAPPVVRPASAPSAPPAPEITATGLNL
ncbi:hypothetical protein [Pseudomonas fluorescens]